MSGAAATASGNIQRGRCARAASTGSRGGRLPASATNRDARLNSSSAKFCTRATARSSRNLACGCAAAAGRGMGRGACARSCRQNGSLNLLTCGSTTISSAAAEPQILLSAAQFAPDIRLCRLQMKTCHQRRKNARDPRDAGIANIVRVATIAAREGRTSARYRSVQRLSVRLLCLHYDQWTTCSKRR